MVLEVTQEGSDLTATCYLSLLPGVILGNGNVQEFAALDVLQTPWQILSHMHKYLSYACFTCDTVHALHVRASCTGFHTANKH